MSLEIAAVMLLLAAATVLFLLEWASVDVITLLLLIATVLSGILTPEEAFSGFANEVIIVLASIFVLSGALAETGVMDRVASWISEAAGSSELRALLILVAVSALVSAFINNTTTTAVMIPTVMSLCRKTGLRPGRLLMPIAFASMLGGTCTLIGTSTNLAASGLIRKLGLAPFTIFEFTPLGMVVAVAGLGYLVWLGHKLLPGTRATAEISDYGLLEYLSEVEIVEDSPLAERTLGEAKLSSQGINVAAILRGGHRLEAFSESIIRTGDLLLVTSEPRDLLRLRELAGVRVLEDRDAPPEEVRTAESRVLEAVIPPDSHFCNRNLRQLNLRRRYRISALAVYRRGGRLAAQLRDLRLRAGDVLLLQGRLDDLEPLLHERELLLLGQMNPVVLQRHRGFYAVGALALAVGLSGLGLMPVSIAFLLSGLLVVLLGCVNFDDVYALIEWRMLILIGGMTSFGLAMQKTGAGVFLAASIAEVMGPFGLYPLLAAFGALTMLLTQPMSNAAAALVVLPVALPTAVQLGIEPRILAVLVTLSASLSFVAPLEPSALLVYGPGKYRFRDFLKAGLPLSLLTLAVLVWLVPVWWG